MKTILLPLLATLAKVFQSRAILHLGILALQQQLAMATHKDRKLRFRRRERLFWIWPGCLETLAVFKADTLVRWHRQGLRLYWTWKSRRTRGGRPPVSREVRVLIRRLSRENSLWGAPRVHGELQMLGIEIAQTTVANYMARHRKPPDHFRLSDQNYCPSSHSAADPGSSFW